MRRKRKLTPVEPFADVIAVAAVLPGVGNPKTAPQVLLIRAYRGGKSRLPLQLLQQVGYGKNYSCLNRVVWRRVCVAQRLAESVE